MYEIATRASSKVVKVEAPYGSQWMPKMCAALARAKRSRSSASRTGRPRPAVVTGIDAYRKVADDLGALLIVDTVASLAAVPLDVDSSGLTFASSGSQKASVRRRECPPITVSLPPRKYFATQNKSADAGISTWTTGHELLGQRPAVSSHTADIADFRVARSDAAGSRRGPGGALGAASRYSTPR